MPITHWEFNYYVTEMSRRHRMTVRVKYPHVVPRHGLATRTRFDVKEAVDHGVRGHWPRCLGLPPVIDDRLVLQQGLSPQQRVWIYALTDDTWSGKPLFHTPRER
jgi:hypothetical protein